jgi:hypothetical protein
MNDAVHLTAKLQERHVECNLLTASRAAQEHISPQHQSLYRFRQGEAFA